MMDYSLSLTTNADGESKQCHSYESTNVEFKFWYDHLGIDLAHMLASADVNIVSVVVAMLGSLLDNGQLPEEFPPEVEAWIERRRQGK